MNESMTPRTDALLRVGTFRIGVTREELRLFDHARQLERALTAALARADKAEAELHRARVLNASSACPICGVDVPHGHNLLEVVHWLRAQASRFVPDADKWIAIDLPVQKHKELTDKIARLEKTIEDYEEDHRHQIAESYTAIDAAIEQEKKDA